LRNYQDIYSLTCW